MAMLRESLDQTGAERPLCLRVVTGIGRGAMTFVREVGRMLADDMTGRSPDAYSHIIMQPGPDGAAQRQFVLGQCAVQEARSLDSLAGDRT